MLSPNPVKRSMQILFLGFGIPMGIVFWFENGWFMRLGLILFAFLIIKFYWSKPVISKGEVYQKSLIPNPLDLLNPALKVNQIKNITFGYSYRVLHKFASKKVIQLEDSSGKIISILSSEYDQDFLLRLFELNPQIQFDPASQEVAEFGTYTIAEAEHAQLDFDSSIKSFIWIGIAFVITFLISAIRQYFMKF